MLKRGQLILMLLIGALVFPLIGRAAEDKEALFQALKSTDFSQRAIASLKIWEKLPTERDRLAKLMLDELKSSEANRRVEAALFIRRHVPKHSEEAMRTMEKDGDVDVRLRLAHRFLLDYKEARAKEVLQAVLKKSDIRTQNGAVSAMRAARALQEGTGQSPGIDEALAILSSKAEYPDIASSSEKYTLRDWAKKSAVLLLLEAGSKVPKEKVDPPLRVYLSEIEDGIRTSNGKEREYWEQSLPTVLDMAVRVGLSDIALEFETKRDLLNDKHERERLGRVLEKAKGKKK